jgi:hypothetical protein
VSRVVLKKGSLVDGSGIAEKAVTSQLRWSAKPWMSNLIASSHLVVTTLHMTARDRTRP